MADHTPHFTPGDDVTYAASAAITGGQLVAISGDKTVAPSTAATSAAVVGVAARDTASGANVLVLGVGIHELTSSGAIAAGANVISGAAGVVTTIGAEADYTKVVGKAVAAAAGNKVLIKLSR